MLADVAKRKANEMEAQAITGDGKEIITTKIDRECDSIFHHTSETEGGRLITSVTHPLRNLTPGILSSSHPRLIAQRRIRPDHGG